MQNDALLWEKTKEILKTKIETHSFNESIDPITKIHESTDSTITLIVKDPFAKFRIEKYWLKDMNAILCDLTNSKVQYNLITEEDAYQPVVNKFIEKDEKPDSTRRNIRKEYNFENFVVGENNRFAYLTALKAAESPFEVANPLYIFGNVGLGKTHLMMAIANYILDKATETNVVYTTAQSFAEDYYVVASQKQKEAYKRFYNYYRSADILLVDDIQFLAGKNATQEEFFKLFEYLNENNKQIVLTSDCPSNELDNIMARLKSRFAWGTPVDIKSPDFEHRKKIVQKKLLTMVSDPKEVSEEIVDYIALNFDSNVRELEGALRRFVNYYMLMNCEPTIELAKDVLAPIISSKDAQVNVSTISKAERIKVIVAKYYQIDPKELDGVSRKKEIAWARQVAMYFIRTQLDMPLQKVGLMFNKKDHTTVMNAEAKVKELLNTDWTVKTQIDEICKKLEDNE